MAEKQIVIGYFREGIDAHRAINALLDDGFRASQIGAAFRSNSLSATGNTAAEDTASVTPERITERRVADTTSASISGPSSGSEGVTAAGLSTGSGSIFSGPSRPGPIPGSEIPRELPRDRSSEPARQSSGETRPAPVGTGSFHDSKRAPEWIEKIRHLFRNRDEPASRPSAPVNDTSMNFGTGEGHLGVLEESGIEFSPSTFEQSFAGMGADTARARYFSGALDRGGAVITVEAGARLGDAEAILERHSGRVRIEGESLDDKREAAQEGARVHVFGQMQTYCPIPGRAIPTRKAS